MARRRGGPKSGSQDLQQHNGDRAAAGLPRRSDVGMAYDTNMTQSGETRSKSLVERLLSPIADVRHGEAASVLLMTLLMFLLLAAYYC